MLPRQELYRKRLALKARYFDLADHERQERLRRGFAAQSFSKMPEARLVLPYFLSHPRASFVPVILRTDPGAGWDVATFRDKHPEAEFHLALAYVALRDTSSFPVQAMLFTDGATAVFSEGEADVQAVRRQVEELKAVGLWVSE